MIFDDKYILNLSIKLSDIDKVKEYSKKVKINQVLENEIYSNIYKYCFDKRIFEIFPCNKINYETKRNLFIDHLLLMVKNNNDNIEMIVTFFSHLKNPNLNFFDNTELDESLIKNIIKLNNYYNKKVKLLDYFFSKNYTPSKYIFLKNLDSKEKLENIFSKNSEEKILKNQIKLINFDLNFNDKNSKGYTNSKILLDEDPTLMEAILLEKIENSTRRKNNDNSYLFEKNNFYFYPIENFVGKNSYFNNINNDIKKNLERFVEEPVNSKNINFDDIENKLLLFNIKLKSMYEIYSVSLADVNLENHLNKQHTRFLEKFIFENIFLEKI